jgi:hypothetical protein
VELVEQAAVVTVAQAEQMELQARQILVVVAVVAAVTHRQVV